MAAGKETMRIPALDFGGRNLKAARHGKELSANADGASFQIKIIPGERGDLSPAERREGLEQQERLPTIGHQIDKGIELIESQHRPFAGPLLAGALDPARVDDDQLILGDRGVQDRAQQTV